MATNSTPILLLGAGVTVALSLAAGFVGGSLATGDGPATTTAPRVVTESTARSRIDELDRRLETVEERLRVTEERANQALERFSEIDDLRRQIAGLRLDAPAADDAGSDADAGSTLASTAVRLKTEAELLAERREQARRIFRSNSAKMLTHVLAGIADATSEGAAARSTQIDIGARQLAIQYSLDESQREAIHGLLREEMDASVQDVSPYLGGGLERADFGAIKTKLGTIWDRRTTRMAEVLDDAQYEDYAESTRLVREAYDKALDELERKRLGE